MIKDRAILSTNPENPNVWWFLGKIVDVLFNLCTGKRGGAAILFALLSYGFIWFIRVPEADLAKLPVSLSSVLESVHFSFYINIPVLSLSLFGNFIQRKHYLAEIKRLSEVNKDLRLILMSRHYSSNSSKGGGQLYD